MNKVNVMCMKWGSKYGPEYVNKLYSMVKRNLTIPFRFACFTDDATGLDSRIEVFPMPEIHVPEKHQISPWRKLTILGEQLGTLSGTTMFLDLDIVIVDNIDCFFVLEGDFCIIENWTQLGQGIGNSSVYRFEVGAHKNVLEHYNNNTDEVLANYRNEQIFLSKKIVEFGGKITYWPEKWCRSFKRHAIPKMPFRYFKTPQIPEGAKIVVFHGHPHPDEAIAGKWKGFSVKSFHKFVRKTPWIARYWQ